MHEKMKSKKLVWLSLVLHWNWLESKHGCFFFFFFFMYEHLFERAIFLFSNLDKLRCDDDYLALIIGMGGLGSIAVAVDIDLQGKKELWLPANASPAVVENHVRAMDQRTRLLESRLRELLEARESTFENVMLESFFCISALQPTSDVGDNKAP